MNQHPGRKTTLRILSWIVVPLLGLAVGLPPAQAAGTTKVTGTLVDTNGKPVPGVKVFFESQDVKKKLPPAKVSKKGKFSYPFLDITSGKAFKVVPQLTDHMVLRVKWISIDSTGAKMDEGDKILDDGQDMPVMHFHLIGQGTVVAGRNEVDFVVVSKAQFAKERQKLLEEQQARARGASTEEIDAARQAEAEKDRERKRKQATIETFNDAVKLARQGRDEEAVKGFEEYMAVDPENPDVHYELGKSLVELGRTDEAEAEFRKALEIKPDLPGPHFRLGMMYARSEQYAEAEKEFGLELDNSPDSAAVLFNLAISQIEQGKNDEAVVHLERVAELNPDNSEVFWKLAQIYEKQGNQAKASEQYDKFAHADPERAAKFFFNIGQEAFKKRDREEAAAAYKKAIEMDPAYADAHRQLGYCLVGMAEFEAAVRHFRKFLELEPSSPHAKEVRETIATLTQ